MLFRSINQDLTVTSISNLSQTQKDAETAAGRTYNNQKFFVGGSRIATVDNISNGKLVNSGKINLVGPLTIGYEVQTDTNLGGNQGIREVENLGTITDKAETTNADLNGALAKGANITLNLAPLLGGGTIDVKRTAEGYTGYKVGLILTYENNDNTSSQNYRLINGSGGTIKFSGEKSIGIQIYAPGSPNTVISAENAGTITVNGAESYGMKISSQIDASRSSFKNLSGGVINVGGGGQ